MHGRRLETDEELRCDLAVCPAGRDQREDLARPRALNRGWPGGTVLAGRAGTARRGISVGCVGSVGCEGITAVDAGNEPASVTRA